MDSLAPFDKEISTVDAAIFILGEKMFQISFDTPIPISFHSWFIYLYSVVHGNYNAVEFRNSYQLFSIPCHFR